MLLAAAESGPQPAATPADRFGAAELLEFGARIGYGFGLARWGLFPVTSLSGKE